MPACHGWSLVPWAIFLLGLFFLLAGPVRAEEIGIAWEFNRNGDAEGWQAFHSLSGLTVAEGVLRATATGDFPQFSGPSFTLNSRQYGFIVVRMRAPGAEDAVFQWSSDSVSWGVSKFSVEGDAQFHEYRVPVFKSPLWRGNIRGLTRFTVPAPPGAVIEIDYIRIVHVGPSAQVVSFKPLRTVWKKDADVPVEAVVRSDGDEAAEIAVQVRFPHQFSVVQGAQRQDLGLMLPGQNDTLRWVVRCSTCDDYRVDLVAVANDSVTTRATLNASVTDRYWHHREFLLSAWSPPCAWSGLQEEPFAYYRQADFDLVLWVAPNDVAVSLTRRYGMHCQLLLQHLCGDDATLRTPEDYGFPEVTDEMLASVGEVIDRFYGDSTVVGYFVVDEPHETAFSNLAKVVRYVRSRDPERLIYINLYPRSAFGGPSAYNHYVERFLDVVRPELLSYDNYVFHNGYDDGDFFSNLAVIRHWALRYDIPFCNIIQAIGTERFGLDWRTPTEAEHRWLVYGSLAYGAKGIIWFHWDADWGVTGSADRDRLFESIKKLNGEIKRIGPQLLGLNSAAVYHSKVTGFAEEPLPEGTLVRRVSENADLVVGFFEDRNDARFVMFVNKSYRDSVTALVTLSPGVEGAEVFDVKRGSWEPVKLEATPEGPQLRVVLRAGGGKLFALRTTASDVAEKRADRPADFQLWPGSPNPFSTATTVRYGLGRTARVKLRLYDVRGRLIRTLVDADKPSGIHTVRWDGRNEVGLSVPNGVYLLTLQVGAQVRVSKLTVLR